eukprot:gene24185-29250_t
MISQGIYCLYALFFFFLIVNITLAAPINVGDTLPSTTVDLVVSNGNAYNFVENQDFGEILRSHKRAVVFAVPGAFTPTCSTRHLPGFIEQADALAEQGVEAIYCLSVNDKHVMRAWALNTPDCISKTQIKMVADGNADFVKAIGLHKDGSGNRMGVRSKRFVMLVEDGVVRELKVDESGLDQSSADSVLKLIEGSSCSAK